MDFFEGTEFENIGLINYTKVESGAQVFKYFRQQYFFKYDC